MLWPWSDSLCLLPLAAKAYNNTSIVVFSRQKATSQPLCVARPLAALFQIAPTISVTWQYQHPKEIPSPSNHNRSVGITWITFSDKACRQTGAQVSVTAPEVTAIISAQHGTLWFHKHKRTRHRSFVSGRLFLPKGLLSLTGQRPRKWWSLRPAPLNEPFSWNVRLNGQKLQQLTDTAKVNAHNLSHTRSLGTVADKFQTACQTNRSGPFTFSWQRSSTNPREEDWLTEGGECLEMVFVTLQFQNEKIYIIAQH